MAAAVEHAEPRQPSDSERTKPPRPLFVWGARLWVLGALAFGAMAVLASFNDTFPGDERIAHAFQDVDVPALGGFIDAVNVIGYWWAYLPIVLGLAFGFALARAGLESLMLLGTLPLAGLNVFLKEWIGRPRPSGLGDAFPSGHTVATSALFALLFLVLPVVVSSPRLRWPLQAGCVLMIVAAGPARVYVDAHWPSDVVAGYLLALLFVAPVFVAYWRLKPGSSRRPSEPESSNDPMLD